jgi:hypothetical protein
MTQPISELTIMASSCYLPLLGPATQGPSCGNPSEGPAVLVGRSCVRPDFQTARRQVSINAAGSIQPARTRLARYFLSTASSAALRAGFTRPELAQILVQGLRSALI